MRIAGLDLDVWLPLTVVFLCRTVICGESPPRILGDRQITYKAKVGETVKLKCRATGGKESLSRRTLFYWEKEKVGLIRTSTANWTRFSVKQNKHLKIKNVQPQDAGEYVCTATNEFGFDDAKRVLVVTNSGKIGPVKPSKKAATKKPERKKIPGSPIPPNFIQDEQPPIILRRLDSNNYKEFPTGSSARLKCAVTGLPTPSISWTKNGEHIQQTDQIRVGTGNTVLVFKFLTKKDSGKYTCTAVNKHGDANYTYIVNVTEHIKFMDDRGIRKEEKIAVYRRNVTLFCETDLKNKRGGLPRVQWYTWPKDMQLPKLLVPAKATNANGKHNRYKKTYSNKNGTLCVGLTVVNVTWEDAGRYLCMIGSGRSRHAIKDVRLNVVVKAETNRPQQVHSTRISSKLQIPLFIVITVPVVAGIICIIVVLACWKVHRKKIQETKRRSRESVEDSKQIDEPLQNGHITLLEKGLNHVPNGHVVVRPVPNGTVINHVSNGKVPNGIKLTVVHHHNSSNGVTTKCIESNGIMPLCHDSETEIDETET